MNRRLRLWSVIPCLAAAGLLVASSCNYSAPQDTFAAPDAASGPAATTPAVGADTPAPAAAPAEERETEKTAILGNVIRQIQSAALNPGGNHFGNATKNLNQYFEGTPADAYKIDPKARELLQVQLPKARVDDLEAPEWTMPDARHLEDCMLYHGIATRVGGVGDDLTRARRVFDWMVRQVQLVPPESLGGGGLRQAPARPYDVLLRGMATEAEGVWSERGWLFLSLCRQLGLDGGLVTYTPRGHNEPVVWCCAVLVGKTPYLFDARIGLPVPDARGDGVATLEEAMTDPAILDRMDLPGQSPYGTTRAALAGSATRIGIQIDSSLRYFSPRMKLLQQSLAGKDLTVLYRDPAEQRDRWAEALGDRLGSVSLWALPITVETRLFTDPNFVQSTQNSLMLFRPELPLLYARMKQLRGETAEAVHGYVSFRLAENPTLMDKKTPMPREFQQALDVYATYFLAMCHLDNNDPKQAERFFERTLRLLPQPGAGRPYYLMYRWGAQANLARLREARGDFARAVAYYSQDDPTSQRHGNLLRARDLVWRDPTAPVPDPLPPPPIPADAPGTQAAFNGR